MQAASPPSAKPSDVDSEPVDPVDIAQRQRTARTGSLRAQAISQTLQKLTAPGVESRTGCALDALMSKRALRSSDAVSLRR